MEEVQHLEAYQCIDCEDECDGYIVETVDNGSTVTSASNDHKQPQDETTCNCTGRMGPCPLEGDCRKEKNIIYCCKVTRQDTMETETYTGLTAKTFKARYYGHNTTSQHVSKKSTSYCTNLKQLHLTRKVKFLDGANTDISGHSQTLEEEKNFVFI